MCNFKFKEKILNKNYGDYYANYKQKLCYVMLINFNGRNKALE